MSRLRGALLLALTAGVLNGLCWLPLGVGPVAPLFAFLFLGGLRRVRSGREALLLGVCFGVARYVVAGHFILALVRYSPLAIVLFLFYVAYIIPFAAMEAWGAFRLERLTAAPRALWAALLFPLLEWLRTVGDLSFPADHLTHDLATFPRWLSLSAVLGPSSTTLLIFLSGYLLELAWNHRARRGQALVAVAGGIALWVAPVATSFAGVPRSQTGGRLDVALVQPVTDVRDKLDPARWPDIWRRLETLSIRGARRGAALVVWPETARPGPVVGAIGESLADPRVQRISRQAGVPILYGCQIARVDGERVLLYNGAALVHPDGRPLQWYGKQRLLPFAEGVPFAELVGWDPSRHASRVGDRSYLRLLGNFTPGPQPTIFEVGPARIGVLVCYEGSYPRLARRYRQQGANLLAVLTDDGWWGDTVFPRWHAAMVATRARENDVPVIRAANNGISSWTGADGSMRARTELDRATVLYASVDLAAGTGTPYTALGELPLLLLGLVLAAGSIVSSRLWRSR